MPALAAFDTAYSLPAPVLTNIYADGSDPGYGTPTPDYETEALLDIEWAHAVAPGAPIRVYIGNRNVSATPLVDALQQAANDTTKCSAISISFSDCNQSSTYFTQTWNTPIRVAFNQNQTIFVASDDYGSAAYLYNSGSMACQLSSTTQGVNEIAANPDVVAVGGTQSPPTDFVWQDAVGASGGGVSGLFAQPTWQTGFGVPMGGNRDLPDVSMLGGQPGYNVYFDPNHNGGSDLGCCNEGTSYGTPIWAGISQLIGQLLSGAPTNGNGRIAAFNTRLYAMGPQGLGLGLFDVTSGNNAFNGVARFSAGPGFDQATGWGRPDISKFVINFVSQRVLLAGGTSNGSAGLRVVSVRTQSARPARGQS